MFAHINQTGMHIPLWLDASHENLGWGISDEYPRQEGAYFGNLFAAEPVAYACKGTDADVDPIAGRLCIGQESCPYVDAAPAGRCEDICEEQSRRRRLHQVHGQRPHVRAPGHRVDALSCLPLPFARLLTRRAGHGAQALRGRSCPSEPSGGEVSFARKESAEGEV